ncbi:MAG: hypothetical protein N2450_02890 [bacterium]|nr:hypothetical protein [bacterium]
MAEFWYYFIGSIPGGWVPIFSILLIFIIAIVYTKIRDPNYPKDAIQKYLLYTFIGWVLLFGILRVTFPPPPYPIRIAVYPLENSDNQTELSYQLSRELEEAFATTNYRFSIGGFRRLSWQPKPSKIVPDSILELPKLLQLHWVVCGEWYSIDSIKNHLQLKITLNKVNTNIYYQFEQEGNPKEVIRNSANQIAFLTKKQIQETNFSMLTPEWRYACANTFQKNLDTSYTEKLFRKAIASDSMNLTGFAWWVDYLCKTNQYLKYQEYLKQKLPILLKNAETYPLFLISLGNFYRLMGESEKAISAFLLANHYAPTNPEPHYYLALLNREEIKTRFQKTAFDHLKRAIELDKGFEIARLKLLSMLQPTGITRDIENYILPGLEIAPYSTDLLLKLSYFQLERFPPNQVIQTLDRLIRIDSTYGDAYYNRGIANLREKDTINAKLDFYSTIQKKGSVEAYYYLGLIHEYNQQWDSAIYYFNQRLRFAKQAKDQIATLRARDKLLLLLRQHRSTKLDVPLVVP